MRALRSASCSLLLDANFYVNSPDGTTTGNKLISYKLGLNLKIRDVKWMDNMVINVYVKFSDDRLSIGKALGNWISDKNKKFQNNTKKNVRSAWESFHGPKIKSGSSTPDWT